MSDGDVILNKEYTYSGSAPLTLLPLVVVCPRQCCVLPARSLRRLAWQASAAGNNSSALSLTNHMHPTRHTFTTPATFRLHSIDKSL